LDTQALKAKLIWQCRRGMLELDLMLNPFVTHHFENLTKEQLKAFEQLLTHSDPEIYHWLMENGQPDTRELSDIVTLIQHQNHT